MNLGVRAHDFKVNGTNLDKLALDELGKKIAEKNLSFIQLALKKSFPEVFHTDNFLSPGIGYYFKETFNKYGISIPVLSCYFNMTNPNMEKRNSDIKLFKSFINFASSFGATMVATETGSLSEKLEFHPENDSEYAYQIVLSVVKDLVREAEKFGIIVAIENSITLTLQNAKKVKRLVNDVNSNNLKIIFDAVGYLNAENFENKKEIIEESLEILKDDIVLVHLKDCTFENGKKVILPPGKGIIDFDIIFKKLKYHKPFLQYSLESCAEENMDEAIGYLKNLYNSI